MKRGVLEKISDKYWKSDKPISYSKFLDALDEAYFYGFHRAKKLIKSFGK